MELKHPFLSTINHASISLLPIHQFFFPLSSNAAIPDISLHYDDHFQFKFNLRRMIHSYCTHQWRRYGKCNTRWANQEVEIGRRTQGDQLEVGHAVALGRTAPAHPSDTYIQGSRHEKCQSSGTPENFMCGVCAHVVYVGMCMCAHVVYVFTCSVCGCVFVCPSSVCVWRCSSEVWHQ